jgi:hypothetical protein
LSEITTAEKEVSSLETSIASLTKEIDQLNAKLHSTRKEDVANAQHIDNERNQQAVLQQELSELKLSLDSIVKRSAELSVQKLQLTEQSEERKNTLRAELEKVLKEAE